MLDDFFDELAKNYEEINDSQVDVRNDASYIKQLEQKNQELRKVERSRVVYKQVIFHSRVL